MIEPIPIAWITDPPMPLIGQGLIGANLAKLTRSGEMWVVAPVSRKNGEASTGRLEGMTDISDKAVILISLLLIF